MVRRGEENGKCSHFVSLLSVYLSTLSSLLSSVLSSASCLPHIKYKVGYLETENHETRQLIDKKKTSKTKDSTRSTETGSDMTQESEEEKLKFFRLCNR